MGLQDRILTRAAKGNAKRPVKGKMPKPPKRGTPTQPGMSAGNKGNIGTTTTGSKLPGLGAGLGNTRPGYGYTGQGGSGQGGGKAMVSTRSITYNSPGQPQPLDIASDQNAQQNYLGSVYVMRCVRLIAETLAALPFVCGTDPFNPGSYNLDAPLSRLLGPATPAAPGGPNPHLNSRAFWTWTTIQYITSGRFAWELQWDGALGKSNIVGLWPLVSICLSPIPISGQTELWSGFQYETPTGQINMDKRKVMYAWRPSIQDWMMPESVLQSAQLPIYLQRELDKYTVNLLKNNMQATTMVISAPFDEADQRRSWEDQFLAEFSGVDRAGATIFGYAEPDETDPAGFRPVQVERLAQTAVEGSLLQLSTNAKNDINIGLGVPRSLLGDASQRTYANANMEYRNFWTITMLNIIAEMQDHVNLRLAPAIGQEVGWFDLSKVEALQPPSIFAPPDIAEAINMGVVTPEQVSEILSIPPPGDQGDQDVETAMIGEEATSNYGSGGAGGRADEYRFRAWARSHLDHRHWKQVRATVPMNSHTYETTWRYQPPAPKRPIIRIRSIEITAGFDEAERIIARVGELRESFNKRDGDTGDGFFGGGSFAQPGPMKAIDVKSVLTAKQPYQVEDEDPYNGVPAEHIEGLGELLAGAS